MRRPWSLNKIKILGLLGLVLLLTVGATPAVADSITIDNVYITGSVTASTVTLTFECTATNCNGWYLGDVTLKGFNFTGTPTMDSNSSPAVLSEYTVVNGGQNNNAVGNGGGCNSTQPNMAVCWDAALPLTLQLTQGVTYTFMADISGGTITDALHVQATAYLTSDGSQTTGNKVWAISNDLSSPPSVPDGGMTLMLLGGVLLGVETLRRKFLI